jgi:hypothetical protein
MGSLFGEELDVTAEGLEAEGWTMRKAVWGENERRLSRWITGSM